MSLSREIKHDIKKYLTIIKGYSQIMNAEGDRKKIVENIIDYSNSLVKYLSEENSYYDKVREKITKIRESSALLKKFSKNNEEINIVYNSSHSLEELVHNSDAEKIDIFSSVNNIITLISKVKNFKIDNHIVPGEYFVRTKKSLLDSALMNLSINAVEAVSKNDERDYVRINAEESEEYVVISVEDSAGMSEEVLNNIGKKGFTTKNEGNGIGVVNVMNYARDNKGRLDFKTEEDRTIFYLYLPKA